MAADLDARFKAVADSVRTFTATKPVPNEDKLKVYALYKQATVGDVEGDRPGMFSFEARAKWDAWNAIKGLDKEEAKRQYIAEVERQQREYA